MPDSPNLPAPVAAVPAAVLTIADVIALVMADPNLESTRRADLASALRTMCRALKTEPESLVANLRDISKRLAKVSPASIGVTPGRWSNVRNLVRAALRLAGIRALPGRYREPLPPAWEALRALLPSDPSKSRVSRLMGFCAANGIAPGAVTEETFALFQSEIENNSLVKRPAAVLHDARLTWNGAADDIPGWPQLRVEVPSRRRDFAYFEEDFPKPFRVSVCDYLTKRANPDVFAEDYCRPMSEKNRAFIRQFADRRKYQALANLPGNLIRRAKRCPTGSRRAAELAAYAVAFQVELVIPLRPDGRGRGVVGN
jgi:hypothetical protein